MMLASLGALVGWGALMWNVSAQRQRVRNIGRSREQNIREQPGARLLQTYLPTIHAKLNPEHTEQPVQLKGVGEAGFQLLHEIEDLLKVGLAPSDAWAAAGVQADERGIPMTRSVEHRLITRVSGNTEALGKFGALSHNGAARQRRLPAHECELARNLAHLIVVSASVSHHLGLSLSAVFATVQGTLHRSIEAEEERRIALAGPKASARLLQLLPLVGLGGAYLLGADPIAWYLTSPLGLIVGASGVGLLLIGRTWTHRLIRRAKETP